MNLNTHVERLREQLAATAEAAGEETRELADQLSVALEPATRLVLLDALSQAADEITREMAPGKVEVRLRSGEPEFVVEPPPSEDEFSGIVAEAPSTFPNESSDDEDGGTARLNLRIPETMKKRIEDAAGAEGLSLNAWLVRAAGSALDHPGIRRGPTGGDRYTGWIR